MIVWLLVHSGLTNANGVYYLFFSGIGADALRAVLVTGVWGGVHRLHKQRERHHKELCEQNARHHKEHMDKLDE